jgi:predicted dehydrogenase
MSTPNIAVIGTGYIGAQHIEAIAENPRAQLHTLCTTPRSRNSAQEIMSRYGALQVTTDYEEVIADGCIDIVYLCTPNSQHVSQAVAALEAGKHTFVEKPLAVTVSDCQRIVEAAKSSGKTVMVGHGARFSKLFETIHHLVHTDTLGEACFVEGDYIHDLKPFLPYPGHDWWMDPEREGQLPIIGGACHPLDLMRWIAGEIVEVSAYGINKNIPEAPWYDTVITNLKFASGAVGKCLVSCGAEIPYNLNFGFHGTKGSIVKNKLFIGGIPNVEEFSELPIQIRAEDHTCPQILDHFLTCIEQRQKPLIDAIDGARSVAVCCAIVESIETGKPARVFLDF